MYTMRESFSLYRKINDVRTNEVKDYVSKTKMVTDLEVRNAPAVSERSIDLFF